MKLAFLAHHALYPYNRQRIIGFFRIGRIQSSYRFCFVPVLSAVRLEKVQPQSIGKNTEADKKSIRNQFMDGYCYYFAHILKTAFNRGDVCWVIGDSHIVWVDTDGIAYDADGEFNKYNGSINDFYNKSLIPENIITPYMKTFKHVPSDVYTRSDFEWFDEFCKENNIKQFND